MSHFSPTHRLWTSICLPRSISSSSAVLCVGLEFRPCPIYRRLGSEVTVVVEMGPRLFRRGGRRRLPNCAWKPGGGGHTTSGYNALSYLAGETRWRCRCRHHMRRRSAERGSRHSRSSSRGTCVAPTTNDLGLDRAGVATDHRGYIIVDDQLQTKALRTWGYWGLQWQPGRVHAYFL